jgi:hypothetical protein
MKICDDSMDKRLKLQFPKRPFTALPMADDITIAYMGLKYRLP